MKGQAKSLTLIAIVSTLIGCVIGLLLSAVLMLKATKTAIEAQEANKQVPLFISQCANGGSGDPQEDKVYCACVDGIASVESNGYKLPITDERTSEIVDQCVQTAGLWKTMMNRRPSNEKL